MDDDKKVADGQSTQPSASQQPVVASSNAQPKSVKMESNPKANLEPRSIMEGFNGG